MRSWPELYHRTEVPIAYDDRSICFAFHCFDNDPSQIRTNVSKRDAAFNDDWIAISLDSAGTGQSAYHLFSNPSASQMDALNTSASGEQFDADMVWFSAANTTADGYVVEVQIPLQTLRFAGGDQVRMGLVFFRRISARAWTATQGRTPVGFQGKSDSVFLGVTVQPNQHITQTIEANTVRFYRADTGVRVYGVNIVNSRTTYQFDKHFLIRFLAQFDSSAKRVLTDLLASYELVPGTVFHAGYGSLYEQQGFGTDASAVAPAYQAVNRGLFFKASYLRRF